MKKDLVFFKKYLNEKLSKKKIIVKKSKFFLNDDNKNIIFIYTIDKSKLNFNLEENTNFFSTKGKIYKIPVESYWSKNFTTKKKITKINTKKISIDLLNEANFVDGKYEYENILEFFSNRFKTKYKVLDNSIIFESKKSYIKSTPITYKGTINFKPFDFLITIDSKKLNFSYIWKNLYLINELISTKLLLNQNLYGKILIFSKNITKNKYIDKVDININFKESDINLDNTKFYSDKFGEIEFYKSKLQSNEGLATLSSKIRIKIKDKDIFHKSFLIPKKARKKIKNLIFDISFQLDNRSININKILFEDENSKIKNFDTIDQIIENNNQVKYDYFNPILFRKFIKEIIIIYSQEG
tara:strand:- start:76 stop:1140 length:1065 start_codon:yes stop_codon:yes gene_type:complete